MNSLDALVPERGAINSLHNKVFALFGLALAVTGLGVFIGFQVLLPVFMQNPVLVYGLWILELGLIFTSGLWSRRKPLNYVLFSLFTFATGLSTVPLLASYAVEFGSFDVIYRSLFATMALFAAMGTIGYTTQKPLSGWYGFLMAGLISMILVSILGIFFPWGSGTEMLVSGLGLLLFAAFAIVDMNRLHFSTEDEAVDLAIELYLDIFNMFLYVLRLTSIFSRD